MKRGKSKLQSRKNLLKTYSRNAARVQKQKAKRPYQRENYDGHDDLEEEE
jgi:hypothetical protein